MINYEAFSVKFIVLPLTHLVGKCVYCIHDIPQSISHSESSLEKDLCPL